MNLTDETDCIKTLGRAYRPFIYNFTGKVGGATAMLIEEYSTRYNICYILDFKKISWGAFNNKTNEFSGSLGLIQRKEYDIYLAPAFSDANRLKYMDATTMVDVVPLTAVYGYPVVGPDYMGFMKTFAWQVWLAAIVTVLLVTLIMMLKAYIDSRMSKSFNWNDKPESSEMTTESYFFTIWRGFIAQSIPSLDNLQNQSAKWFILYWIIASLFINMSYKCNLLAALIIPKINIPFNNYEEMTQQTKVKWILTNGTVLNLLAQSSPKNNILRKIYDGTSLFTVDTEKTLHLMQTDDYAYVVSEKASMGFVKRGYTEDRICTITMMKGNYWMRPMFLLLAKNSPHKENLDKMIMRLREAGIFQLWMKNTMGDSWTCLTVTRSDGSKLRALTVEDFLGIFSVLVGGLILASIVFILELLVG